jgi:hypothetical protein
MEIPSKSVYLVVRWLRIFTFFRSCRVRKSVTGIPTLPAAHILQERGKRHGAVFRGAQASLWFVILVHTYRLAHTPIPVGHKT